PDGTKTADQSAPPARTPSVDSVASAKPADSVLAAKPETPPARVDTAPPTKSDSTAKLSLVATAKSTTVSTPPPPKTAPKRDSVQTRPDSIAARCAALNLKFSVGEEVTRSDSSFLRRECAKY